MYIAFFFTVYIYVIMIQSVYQTCHPKVPFFSSFFFVSSIIFILSGVSNKTQTNLRHRLLFVPPFSMPNPTIRISTLTLPTSNCSVFYRIVHYALWVVLSYMYFWHSKGTTLQNIYFKISQHIYHSKTSILSAIREQELVMKWHRLVRLY